METVPLTDFSQLVCDYIATLNNTLGFNVKLAKRAVVKVESLKKIWETVQSDNIERSFEMDTVKSVS